jgi:hypothetical protein
VLVSGTVTLDGEPVAGISVAFVPKGSDGREAYGLTDARGLFTLTISGTEPGSGAIPGEYHVTFSKMSDPLAGINTEGLDDEAIEREMAKRFPKGLPSAENLLPAKYADRNATDIAPVKVERGGKNDFAFNLASQ